MTNCVNKIIQKPIHFKNKMFHIICVTSSPTESDNSHNRTTEIRHNPITRHF